MGAPLILSIVSIGISFITFWIIFIRDSKKSFHGNLYNAKQNSYVDLVTKILSYLDEVYELLEFQQDFEGNEDEWTEAIQKESPKFYDMAAKLKSEVYKHVMILPSKSMEKVNEITSLASGHITNHYHFKNDAAASSFERLYILADDFINLGREDLRIDKFDKTLNNRISKTFYPLGFSDKLNNKKV